MKATLTFPERWQAEAFAKNWSRQTLTGHTIGAGTVNVQVTVDNVTEESKKWIDEYVAKLNQLSPA